MAGRITQQSISNVALRGLQANLTRMQKLQEAVSSGKKISQPSDDPSGTAAAMTLRSRRAADDQYLRNIDLGSGRLAITDTALGQLSERLTAVRNLVIESRNGSLGSDSQGAIAAQITAIKGEVVDLYNTTYLGRPVFGGTTPGNAAINTDGEYKGDDNPVQMRISADAVVRVDVGGKAVGADALPGILDSVAAHVTDGTVGDQDLQDIDGVMAKLSQSIGDLGAREKRVETTRAMVESHQLDLTSRISLSEDIDLPEAMMTLASAQLGYQAALQSAAKIQQNSLMDFLK